MTETKNGRLGLYGAEHSKSNHMTKLGFIWQAVFTFNPYLQISANICRYLTSVNKLEIYVNQL